MLLPKISPSAELMHPSPSLSFPLPLPFQARKHIAALSQWHPVQETAKQPKTGCNEQLFFCEGTISGKLQALVHMQLLLQLSLPSTQGAFHKISMPNIPKGFLNSMPDKRPKSHTEECCF